MPWKPVSRGMYKIQMYGMQIIAGLIIPDNTSFKGKFWEKVVMDFLLLLQLVLLVS